MLSLWRVGMLVFLSFFSVKYVIMVYAPPEMDINSFLLL